MSDGRASKIIIPSNVVDMTRSNVMFSETSGLGDVTVPDLSDPVIPPKDDPCCD